MTDQTLTTTTEATSTPSEGANTTPSASIEAAPTTDQPVVDPAAAPPAYTPNLKYKYLSGDGSNRVEKEFPEFLRGIIKDEATEKQLRELHERAYGLDFVKSDRQKQKERADTVESEFGQVKGQLEQLGKLKEAKDYDSFLEMLGVSEDEILQHAVKIAQRRQNPQAQEVYQQQRQSARQAMTLEQENAQLKSQHEQYAVQMRTQELETVLSRPDVAATISSFDDRVGAPGAFRNEVIKRGQLYHAVHGQDISVEQAVGEVLSLIGAQPPQQASPPVAEVTVPPAAGQQAPQPKPVIPHIAGKGTSPSKRVPKSTADLRAIASNMSAEG